MTTQAGRDNAGTEIHERRTRSWAATMAGHADALGADVVAAHRGTPPRLAGAFATAPGSMPEMLTRQAREEADNDRLATGATLAEGSGRRKIPEDPDPFRTCFERDRDRIVHGTAFRRLAGKTQVVVFPKDHQRTRLTHALEVAQVARSIATTLRLNVALTEAIALGHDCGHGPGGHASEDAFAPYVEGGYDHAVWGADVTLDELNLCSETLDGIRNHSWSRPTPATPEGAVVSWADRIAYVCHDFEDAVHTEVIAADQLPELVVERCGTSRSSQLSGFIAGVCAGTMASGHVCMDRARADALAAFRHFNYAHIYMRPESVAQGDTVVRLLRALVEFYAERPGALPLDGVEASHPRLDGLAPGSPEAQREAVAYVSGMTDRYAFDQAVRHLGWRRDHLPATGT